MSSLNSLNTLTKRICIKKIVAVFELAIARNQHSTSEVNLKILLCLPGPFEFFTIRISVRLSDRSKVT